MLKLTYFENEPQCSMMWSYSTEQIIGTNYLHFVICLSKFELLLDGMMVKLTSIFLFKDSL